MIKITKEEVLKIARMSYIDIHEDEIEAMMSQLQEVLSYAQRVKEVAHDVEVPSNRRMNVFREDVINKTNPEPIRARAPQREGNYFVVPAIIEK